MTGTDLQTTDIADWPAKNDSKTSNKVRSTLYVCA